MQDTRYTKTHEEQEQYDVNEFFRDRDPSSPEIDALLVEAARLHVKTFGAPPDTATSSNIFLWAAEAAFSTVCPKCECGIARHERIPSSGYYLYRLWSEEDRLLYVGISRRLSARISAHRKKWGDLIARVTWESCEDERDAVTRESAAIHDENPAFNWAGVAR